VADTFGCDKVILVVGHGYIISLSCVTCTFPILLYNDMFLVYAGVNNYIFQLPVVVVHLQVVTCMCIFVIESILTGIKWCTYVVQGLIMGYYFPVMTRRLVIPIGNSMEPVNLGEFLNRIVVFRSIHIIILLFNHVFQTIVICTKFGLISLVCIGFAMCILHGLSLVTVIIATFSSMLVNILLVNYVKGAAVYESSVKFLDNYRKLFVSSSSVNYQFDRRYLTRILESLRPCKILAGESYFLNYRIVILIVNAIIHNTINIVIAFGK